MIHKMFFTACIDIYHSSFIAADNFYIKSVFIFLSFHDVV